MIRIVLLVIGFILLFLQQYITAISNKTQFIIFLIGIILLGIPHGAADLLVASRNADESIKSFSKFKFLKVYVSRLILFAGILWFFPVTGNLLFILFAAYHFGETDLHQFKTNTFLGKLFVISYGLVILSIILLPHFEEVKPIYQLFEAGKDNNQLILWIDLNRYYILSAVGILFFTATFIYFLKNVNTDEGERGQFLIRFAALIIILFNLPMLLGFTFYFVVWHSVLSLKNIILYLRNNNKYSLLTITKQILLYSVMAIAGVMLFGLTGFMFTNTNAIAGYIFLGLAVLTAPHMQIMHDMYNSIRLNK
ncbi:MAG: Brp/Blh family beta-carotene 15,15'-dioxygenase [Chitinophagaceae bacterium]|nr:Brp/Blh family beta-carotene 15,15'-dioxygenase [Chitinophagaceae bacterium]